MKSVALYVVNPIRSPYKHDQYDSFRSEGRIPINIGFGLSLLGFESNIIFNEWKIDSVKKVWNNVYLSNEPILDYYDYLVTWDINHMNLMIDHYDTAIFMDWIVGYTKQVYDFIKRTNKKVIYTNIVNNAIFFNKINGITHPLDVKYFPGLFPIPSYHIGFVPYNYEKKFNLKILFMSPGDLFFPKIQFILDFFKNKGYNIEIDIIMFDEKPQYNSFKNYKVQYFVRDHFRYVDILDKIKSSDICITCGTNLSGTSLHDIVSLGKPIIYMEGSKTDIIKDKWTNLASVNHNYIIYLIEKDYETLIKLEEFIKNPKESYDAYKESFKDLDFNNWKEHAKKFFIP